MNDPRATIRTEMNRLGLSQSELARRSGMTPSQMSRYLSGIKDVKAETLVRIANTLGLRLTKNKN